MRRKISAVSYRRNAMAPRPAANRSTLGFNNTQTWHRPAAPLCQRGSDLDIDTVFMAMRRRASLVLSSNAQKYGIPPLTSLPAAVNIRPVQAIPL